MKRLLPTLLLSLSVATSMLGGLPARAEQPASEPVSTAWRVGGVIAGSPLWTQYKARFVRDDGRIVDTGNGGKSHSEGQGYGMLLAVAADDRATFDRIFAWTKENLLVRDDNLAAWTVNDPNDAADADILIAWALAEAADQWREPRYAVLATWIAREIGDDLVSNDARYGMTLKPGFVGFSAAERPDGPVVNPSYWVLPAFNRLKQLAPNVDWGRLARSGVSLMESSRLTDTGLTTDWVALGASGPKPARGFSESFGYNSIRIPLYLFWSGAQAPEFMARFAGSWKSEKPAAGLADFSEPGYGKVAALANCAVGAARYPESFYSFEPNQNYYPATLSALSTVAAILRGGPCLDMRAMSEFLGQRMLQPASNVALGANIKTLDASLKAPVATPAVGAPPTPAPQARPRPVAETASEPDQDETSYLGSWILRALLAGGVVAVLIAAKQVLKLRSHRRIEKLIEENFVQESRQTQTPGAPRTVPRVLPRDPFSPGASDANFGVQIETAAGLSVEYGRTLGVLLIDLGQADPTDANRAEQLNALLGELRVSLRSTDCVRLRAEREIVIAVPLLEGLEQLERVGNRVCAIGRQKEMFKEAFEAGAGSAIFPVCGYRGEDLIEYARRRYRALIWAKSARKPDEFKANASASASLV